MSQAEQTTQARILAAAMAEFLEKGFRAASLRSIVKAAGVTTGAFYGYYASKQELFRALVGEVYEHILSCYRASVEAFGRLPAEEQPGQMGKISRACMRELLYYGAAHRDEMQLILQGAEGTRYAFLIDELVEQELDATHRYGAVLQQLGHPVRRVDARLEHILITGMMNAYFEMLLYEMPLDDTERYLEALNDFYTAGWRKLLGQ